MHTIRYGNFSFLSQTRDTVDSVLFWKIIFYGCWVFGLVFFTCELGQKFTDIFDKIANQCNNQLDWYLFPIAVQRMLSIVIINVQESLVWNCFGIVSGTRDQFKKVNHKGIICQMLIKFHKPIKFKHKIELYVRWSLLCIKALIRYIQFSTRF